MPPPSRRDFVTTAGKGAGGVAAALHAPGLLTACASQEPGRRLGFALCGLGSLSANQLAPALTKTRHARLAGVKLAVGYRCQFEPHHLECIRLARDREFGDLKVIEAAFGFLIGDPAQWRLRAELAGGGALMDAGIYALQACRYLTGEEPNDVSAFETKTDPVKFAEVEESITWQMSFPSGILATCATSYNARRLDRFRVYARQGWFGLEPAYRYGGLVGERSDGKPLRFEQIDHFAAEIDDFSRCVLESRESKVSGEEGRRDLAVIEAIYRSVQAGCAVGV